jgi:RNA methyltransferase, TrmH family
VQDCAENQAACYETSSDLLQRISETDQPQGILAIMPIPHLVSPNHLDFILVLDSIRDPGNAGTILRTAAAAGVQAVWLAPGCTDVYAPKVMRSAMGAHFHLAIEMKTWQEIAELADVNRIQLYLADSAGGKAHHTVDLSQPVGLVICNEAEGPSTGARAAVKQLIHIRMPGEFESLNAGIAAAILMFEVVRQRNR